ncbi:MAG: ABC-F family ATP-binding cassette domain-containing protein [Actinomycetota bacterium]
MISITGLDKGFGARRLLRGAELRIGARDRLVLVGPNGSGKTTLFEMIVGDQEPDAGSISVTRGAKLGYLPQTTDALRGRTIIQEVLTAAPAMAEVGHRLEILTGELAENDLDAAERDALIEEYARLQERFSVLGGYSAEARAREICAGLGFSDADLDGPTDSLSGGWLMRVALAKLLVSSPDALLLDEPTNHLDLESVRFLEQFLKTFEGAVLLISHDRDFMNGFATRVVEIERETLVGYTGNYESFVAQREMRARQSVADAANLKRRTDQLELFINRFRYKKTKASQVQSKIKLLEKMGSVEVIDNRRRAMSVRFPPAPRSARVVIELENVSFAYGDKRVYDGLDFAIERGQKVALVGPNGAGKSTLLKLLAGALIPDKGERRLGQNVHVGYFAQHQIEALDPAKRVIEELDSAVPLSVVIPVRGLLGRFLFSGSDVDKPVSVLSGGERSRLAMAKILVSTRNFLCLDEPTNHLDIWSRDALEDALEEYDGALVLITHDRHLIRSVADTIAEVRDGRVRLFPGSYEEYLATVEAEENASSPAPTSATTSPAKERRRASAAERTAANRRRNALRRVEEQLDAVHAEIRAMEERMADPGFYANEDDIAAFMRTYSEAKGRVGPLEAQWETLAE